MATPEDTQPAATIYGLELTPLDDNYIPLAAIVLVKALTDDGDMTLVIKHAETIHDWERIGILTAALDVAKAQTLGSWCGDDDPDDDD